MASESCERRSSVDVGTALPTIEAAVPSMDWLFDEEVYCDGSTLPGPLLSGAERVCGVAASGAGEPKEGEGKP